MSSRLRQWIVAALILSLFTLTGATGAPPTSRQQTVTGTWFHLSVRTPPLLCVGQVHKIVVTPLVDLISQGSKKFDYTDRVVTGVQIRAEISNTSIATISPSTAISGTLPASLFDGTIPLKDAAGSGELVFTLRALKTGTTNLILTGKVPRQWSRGQERYFGPDDMPAGGPIKVVNCKYRVTTFMSLDAHYGNLDSYILSRAVGAMETETGELFSGSAIVDWSAFSFSVMCYHTHTVEPALAKITGTPDQSGLITVQITYDPTAFSTKNCGSSNAGILAVGPVIVQVPPEGGHVERTYTTSWGNESLSGSVGVYVTPIEKK